MSVRPAAIAQNNSSFDAASDVDVAGRPTFDKATPYSPYTSAASRAVGGNSRAVTQLEGLSETHSRNGALAERRQRTKTAVATVVTCFYLIFLIGMFYL